MATLRRSQLQQRPRGRLSSDTSCDKQIDKWLFRPGLGDGDAPPPWAD